MTLRREPRQGIAAFPHPVQHLRIMLRVFMDAGQQRLQALLRRLSTVA